jgi:hypothetical protein
MSDRYVVKLKVPESWWAVARRKIAGPLKTVARWLEVLARLLAKPMKDLIDWFLLMATFLLFVTWEGLIIYGLVKLLSPR